MLKSKTWCRLWRETHGYRLALGMLLCLEILAVPLALAVPIPLAIAVDSAIGKKPVPAWLQVMIPATLHHIEQAARAAEAHDFIMALPDGYHTTIGERGYTLSGGQRQRLSIARTFLKDAPIVILDEPTSSVDSATEERIMSAVHRLIRGRTTFLISHRPSVLKMCHYVLHLRDGLVDPTLPIETCHGVSLTPTRVMNARANGSYR